MSQFGQNNGRPNSGSPYANYVQNQPQPSAYPGQPYASYTQNAQNPAYSQNVQNPAYPQAPMNGQNPQYPPVYQGQPMYPQQNGPAYPNVPNQPAYPNYPNQGYVPNQSYPNQGYPNQNYPNQGYPNQGYVPNPGYAPQTNPMGQPNSQPSASQNKPKPEKEKKFPAMEPDLLILFIGAILIAGTFIASLVFPVPAVKWAFLSLALLGLAYIWVRPVLETGPKTTASVLIGVAVLVTVLSMVLTPVTDRTQPAGPTARPDTGSSNQSEQTGANDPMSEEYAGGALEEVESIQVQQPTATPDNESATLENLRSFCYFWTLNKTDQMVGYCAPSWVKSQEKPNEALFTILANRRLVEYTIGTPNGTINDGSRTVPVTAAVVKPADTKTSVFIFNVLILKENETWYVDPKSLKSHEEVEATTFSVIITQPPTPQPAAASMILYYNVDGGSYYHADPYCEAVAEKYRPLTGQFTYGQINEPAYANLKTCQRCAAPMR